jgi:hypothetical protein
MRFYISPFGYVSYRVVLAVGFTLAAIGILFFDVIIRMFLVFAIGFIGWGIGALIDDKAFSKDGRIMSGTHLVDGVAELIPRI